MRHVPHVPLPRIGMRVVKTAVSVMLSYALFVPFGLMYHEELGGVLGQLGPTYACIACIICTQSTLGQTVQQGISRLIGVAVGGCLGIAALQMGTLLDDPWVRMPVLGAVCVAGVWLCLLIKRPTACGMACILPCVILISRVTGDVRYYYAAARIIETVAGVTIALAVNALLPDHRKEERGAPTPQEFLQSIKPLCVIGDPVGHSLSPRIQGAMLKASGLDAQYRYGARQVPAGDTCRFLAHAAAEGYAGFNATMPHKEALVPLMDELSPDARMYRSVNTVCIKGGRFYGYNTDGVGFLQALREVDMDPEGRKVLLLGAGGAAKAVAPKLIQAGAERVFVANRTVERAAALCAWDEEGRMVPRDFRPETLRALAAECTLVVNCTSLGMTGTAGQFEDLTFLEALPHGAGVFDLIYSPAKTALLERAEALGHPISNGLGMLIWQAVFALECFTDTRLDRPAMAAAARKALEEEHTPALSSGGAGEEKGT